MPGGGQQREAGASDSATCPELGPWSAPSRADVTRGAQDGQGPRALDPGFPHRYLTGPARQSASCGSARYPELADPRAVWGPGSWAAEGWPSICPAAHGADVQRVRRTESRSSLS